MKKILFLFISVLYISFTCAQVGINTSTPNNNALLHISEINQPTDAIQAKGILIPRLSDNERDAMTFIDPLAEPKEVKLTAIDNSLMIFNTTENCYNYWNFEEESWKSLCGDIGNAKFNMPCGDNIQVNGNYVEGKDLDATNYIAIAVVNVTKTGAYTITATADVENGYSFVAQGIFTATGPQNIRLIGQGKPINPQTDNFTVTASDPTVKCASISVKVQPNIASYSLNCASTVVKGTYLKGQALTSNNTITMNVNVSALGSYEILTKVVNGIQFSTKGIFTSTGVQAITLIGIGTPSVNDDFSLEINANTVAGNAICNALIPVMLPAMTYAVLGSNNVYSWHPSNIRAKAFNGSSFGPNGTVKIVSLTNIWNTTSASTAVANLKTTKPDIVLYFAYGVTSNQELGKALGEYVNEGGVLIFGTKDGAVDDTNFILNGIFGEAKAQQQIAGSGSLDDNVYPINNYPNDPIINGPFGNTAGKYWGEDNTSNQTIVVSELPPNSIQIAAANNQFSKTEVDPSYSTVWYNNSKNFVYFGDSTGASSSSTSLLEYPTIYTSNGIPKSKRYGQYPNQNAQAQFVYNSILELNAVAWGLRKAAVSGINPH